MGTLIKIKMTYVGPQKKIAERTCIDVTQKDYYCTSINFDMIKFCLKIEELDAMYVVERDQKLCCLEPVVKQGEAYFRS